MSELQIKGYERDPNDPNKYIPVGEAKKLGDQMLKAAADSDGNFPGERYTVETSDSPAVPTEGLIEVPESMQATPDNKPADEASAPIIDKVPGTIE